MLPSWFRQSVKRIRPAKKTVRGSTLPDWENAAEAEISGCSVQPSTTSLSQDGRVLGVAESYTLYMPADADVQEGDRIIFDSKQFVVRGIPGSWVSPTGALNNKQVTLERWDG